MEGNNGYSSCLQRSGDDSFTSDGDAGESVGYTGSSNDQRLVLAARSGCRTAFNNLWELYSRRVYRTILGITNNAQDAEDALQDSFFRAFVVLDSFEGRASFYSWLTRIAINSALGVLRKRRSHPETSLNTTSLQEDESAPEGFRDWLQILSKPMPSIRTHKAYAGDRPTPHEPA